MTRRLISSGSTFEREIGYSRAVVDGDWIFVSGTTGFDYAAMTIATGVVEQALTWPGVGMHSVPMGGTVPVYGFKPSYSCQPLPSGASPVERSAAASWLRNA